MAHPNTPQYLCKVYATTGSDFCIGQKVVESEADGWDYLWETTRHDNLPFAYHTLEPLEVAEGEESEPAHPPKQRIKEGYEYVSYWT